jgi:hypothetical protein
MHYERKVVARCVMSQSTYFGYNGGGKNEVLGLREQVTVGQRRVRELRVQQWCGSIAVGCRLRSNIRAVGASDSDMLWESPETGGASAPAAL